MPPSDLSKATDYRQTSRQLTRAAIEQTQLAKLNQLLSIVVKRPFYRERLARLQLPLLSLDQLGELSLLEKAQLENSQLDQSASAAVRSGRGPATARRAAAIFDLPREQYVRFHQTSGTSGWPLPVLDTADDWQWWIECWQYVLDAADVTDADTAMMAFSFGPFIGFWTAHDALVARGAMVVPGGGLSSEARLRLIDEQQCTVLCCTPTYALHLASVAEGLGIRLTDNSVRRIIVAGEPGGSIATTRSRIEQAWGARVVDHSGASEIGAWGFDAFDPQLPGLGLHIIETEFIAEFLVIDASGSARSAKDGELSELVLTSLGRTGGPVIRYRTGDIVRGAKVHDRRCRFVWLSGGVLGRSDDMMVIRGVNVFPSSIEAIVREVAPTAEFRMLVRRNDEMDHLEIELEADEQVGGNPIANQQTAGELSTLLRDRLAMRVVVNAVEFGSLPRYEAKSRRFVDLRNEKR